MTIWNKIINYFKIFFGKDLASRFSRAGKWSLHFVLIGLIAGCGAVVFHWLCQLGVHYFLDLLAGYRPPGPAGEHNLLEPTTTAFNRWVLLILPAVGGLVSGWLVYTFAPEAEGHGTDAAIDAYHRKGGFIRGRVPIVKTIASSITLTTGCHSGASPSMSKGFALLTMSHHCQLE